MSASLTKPLKLMLPRRGGRSTWAQAVRLAITQGQSDTAYELARGLAHMVRHDWAGLAKDHRDYRAWLNVRDYDRLSAAQEPTDVVGEPRK